MKRSFRNACALALAGMMLSGLAPAASEEAETEPEEGREHRTPLGTRTRAWLDLQRSGRAAGEPVGLAPPAERRALQRYLESFSHPIPDLFEIEKASKGSAGGRR